MAGRHRLLSYGGGLRYSIAMLPAMFAILQQIKDTKLFR
jgi:hypothetical protein